MSHITREQRYTIEVLLSRDASQVFIAEIIGKLAATAISVADSIELFWRSENMSNVRCAYQNERNLQPQFKPALTNYLKRIIAPNRLWATVRMLEKSLFPLNGYTSMCGPIRRLGDPFTPIFAEKVGAIASGAAKRIQEVL